MDIPIYKPTPRDRPVSGPIIGVRLVDDLMYDPMLREWPVDDQIFEPKTQLRPVGGQTLRESPVDALVCKPTPRERPGGEKPYGPRPKERPVDVPKPKGRPLDGLGYEPILRERPVGTDAYELRPEEWPVANPKLMGRPVDEKAKVSTPVDDEAYEPMTESRPVADPRLGIRPVDVVACEPTPRDNQTIMRRPADGEKSIPMTDGRPAVGPKTIIRPKEGAVDPEAVPLLNKAPPPSEVPEWSDGEVMPLIIIEHNSGVVIPKTTGRVPVGSDILLPQSLEIRRTRVYCRRRCRQIGSGRAILRICQQKEVYLMCRQTSRVSTCDRPGRGTASRYYPAPAAELRRLQQPVLRSTNCVC